MEYRSISLRGKFNLFSEQWQAKVIAEMNEYQFKVVRLQGDFVWHSHESTDETFIVLEGDPRIDFRDGAVPIGAGELYVVPRGVERKPFAERQVKHTIIEPRGVLNTGDQRGDRTAQNDVWIYAQVRHFSNNELTLTAVSINHVTQGVKMLTEEEARNLAAHWVQAWNSHDLDDIMSHYAEAVVLVSPVATRVLNDPSGTVKGKHALRAYFKKGLENYPNLKFDLLDLMWGLSSVVLYYVNQNGKKTGEFMEIDSNGKVIRVVANYSG